MESEEFKQNTNFVPRPVQENYSNEIVQKPKKHRKLFIVLSIIGLIIVIGGILLGVAFFKGQQNAQESSRVLTSFLTHLSNDNYSNAYDLISDKWKASSTEEKFTQDMNSLKIGYDEFKSQEMTGWRVVALTGQPLTCYYGGVITHADGKTDNFESVLFLENGTWKIVGFKFNFGPDRIRELQNYTGSSIYNAYDIFVNYINGIVGK